VYECVVFVILMGKVAQYNLQDDIIELVLQGESSKSIARIFKKRGIEISWMTIQRWINKNKEIIHLKTLQNDTVKERVVTNTLNASESILELTGITKRILFNSLQDGDRASSLRALERLEKQLLLYTKLVGMPGEDSGMVHFLEHLPPAQREAIKNVLNGRNT